MPLTTNMLSAETPYVHMYSKNFMHHRTTYFLKPHEYVTDNINDCVGLFAFSDDKSIIFAVLSDGKIKEITKNYFPQAMISNFETRFAKIVLDIRL